MSSRDIYILGGSQTDFARNWAREGLEIADMFAEALVDAVASPTWQGVVACAAGVQGGATLASCADASM